MEGMGEVECTQNEQNKAEDVVQTEKGFLKLPSPLNCSSVLCECSVFLFSSSGDKERGWRAANRRVKWRLNRDSQNSLLTACSRSVTCWVSQRLQSKNIYTINMQTFWGRESGKYYIIKGTLQIVQIIYLWFKKK